MTHALARQAPPAGSTSATSAPRCSIGSTRASIGGRFILRLDDTDRERSTEAFAQGIRDDLAWLGLTWEREERQSARTDRYAAAAAQLSAAGRLYPCLETGEELDRKRKRQLARGLPPFYDRASLKLAPDDRARLEAEAGARAGASGSPTRAGQPRTAPDDRLLERPRPRRADRRCRLAFGSRRGPRRRNVSLHLHERDRRHRLRRDARPPRRGPRHQHRRADPAVRGDGTRAPAFAHHNLLVGRDGHALSKRDKSLSVASLREAGLEPMAVACHAALVGTSDAVEPLASLDELAARLDLARISTAPARFDPAGSPP